MTKAESILLIWESAGMHAQMQALRMCENDSIWIETASSNNLSVDGNKTYGFPDDSEITMRTDNSLFVE